MSGFEAAVLDLEVSLIMLAAAEWELDYALAFHVCSKVLRGSQCSVGLQERQQTVPDLRGCSAGRAAAPRSQPYRYPDYSASLSDAEMRHMLLVRVVV